MYVCGGGLIYGQIFRQLKSPKTPSEGGGGGQFIDPAHSAFRPGEHALPLRPSKTVIVRDSTQPDPAL
jgi:hypothetical protein